MIPTNELRIGSKYINHADKIQDWGLSEFQWLHLGVPIENIIKAPIPLTPEILEKCGFGQLPHFTVGGNWIKGIGRNRFISIACVGTPNEIVFLTEEEGKEVKAVIVLRNYDYDGRTYLHQLQNIIHAITGEELTVNL